MTNRKVIDRGMIEEFGAHVNSESSRRVCYTLSDNIDDIAMELSQANPFVNIQNTELLLAGDFFTNTPIVMSELDFYLVVRSAQIELNSIGPMEKKWRVWLERLRVAWGNRNKNSAKARKRAAKKAKKDSKKKVITQKDLTEKKEKPYTIASFKTDFFEGLTERVTNLTVLYNQANKIRILAKDEFGFRINIYPAIKHDDGLKIWDTRTNKFILTQPDEAKKLLEEKNQEILKNNSKIEEEDILYSIIRVFKNIFYNVMQSYNYSFLESVIYSCPNSLFKLDKESEHPVYEVFLKVLNYLNNANISNIRSIYNQEKTIYQQHGVTVYGLKSFLKEVNEYLI